MYMCVFCRPEMGKWNGKSCRLISMLSMTFVYFVVELVMGHVTGSLALVADSFHMLSDVVALIVGLLSVRVCYNNFFYFPKASILDNCPQNTWLMNYLLVTNFI